jgi:hypothetical protein
MMTFNPRSVFGMSSKDIRLIQKVCSPFLCTETEQITSAFFGMKKKENVYSMKGVY